jgi:TatD DNase family protein
LIDVHCHVDLYSDPIVIASESEHNNISTIAMTNLPSHFKMGYPHLLGFTKIHLALGLHPLMAERHHRELNLFEEMLPNTNFIGEIGLDFSKEGIATKAIQTRSLHFILALLKNTQKYISLHSRGAESSLLEFLDEYKIKNAVLHWYSGSKANLKLAIESGLYFSINPAMAISQKGRKIIEFIPRELILTETDGPYLQIDGRAAKPIDVKLVLNYLSNVWEQSLEEAEDQIETNFNYILGKIWKSYESSS